MVSKTPAFHKSKTYLPNTCFGALKMDGRQQKHNSISTAETSLAAEGTRPLVWILTKIKVR
jgi:hypothetical protein